MKSHLGIERFAWREGNCIELLVNGEQFYEAMLRAIDTARHSVCLEMYLTRSGRVATRFVEAWVAAAQRGVRVRLLLDAYGSLGLDADDRERLRRAGVELALYNPLRWMSAQRNLLRTHRKLLLIDARSVFIGGNGISDDFIGEHGWRETVIKVEGPVLVDWQRLFRLNWRRWADSARPLELLEANHADPHCRDPGMARVASSNAGLHSEIKRALLARMKHCERRVWLATAYFIPTRKLRRALRRAARRGVDVRLLLPGGETDHPAVRRLGQRFYARLLRHGVKIYEYQGRFMHTKAVLVDDWASLGSCNMDRWNLRWNLEANQEIDSVAFASQLARLFEHDLGQSEPIDYLRWRRRSRLQRIKEWFWGRLDLLVARWLASWRGDG